MEPAGKMLIDPRPSLRWDEWDNNEEDVGEAEEDDDRLRRAERGIPAPLAVYREGAARKLQGY